MVLILHAPLVSILVVLPEHRSMFDLGECTIRRFLSTVDNPRKVERARVPNYSWPPEIQGLNSAREHRRAHMKAVLWHEQVVLDNSDQALIGGDACVLELTLSKRSASEVMAAAAKVQKRVRRLMLDSGCGIDLIGMHDLSVGGKEVGFRVPRIVVAYREWKDFDQGPC